jgi:hypothetical protein
MFKTAVILIVGGAVLSLAYFAGVFVTSFDTNMCYSNAMGNLARESAKIMQDQKPERIAAYQAFVAKLPLSGYETNCHEVENAVERFLQSNNEK